MNTAFADVHPEWVKWCLVTIVVIPMFVQRLKQQFQHWRKEGNRRPVEDEAYEVIRSRIEEFFDHKEYLPQLTSRLVGGTIEVPRGLLSWRLVWDKRQGQDGCVLHVSCPVDPALRGKVAGHFKKLMEHADTWPLKGVVEE